MTALAIFGVGMVAMWIWAVWLGVGVLRAVVFAALWPLTLVVGAGLWWLLSSDEELQ